MSSETAQGAKASPATTPPGSSPSWKIASPLLNRRTRPAARMAERSSSVNEARIHPADQAYLSLYIRRLP